MKIRSILVIIQRSNGDVLLSASLINQLSENLKPSFIDVLVNNDTTSIAKSLNNINKVFTFSYKEKKHNRIAQEIRIFKQIFRNYDLCINLTSSDRSVIYTLLAAKKTISAVEKNKLKSWWKILLLKHSYIFEENTHILLNNLKPLRFLNIKAINKQAPPMSKKGVMAAIQVKLLKLNIDKFIIFHPSAQYDYKIYDKQLRLDLLFLLDSLNISIIVTGGKTQIDKDIKYSLPKLNNIYDFIGETSIEEFIVLSSLSDAYIGMDTLNMHIAASQNKRIFAIFGPTNPIMWAPWSNFLQTASKESKPIQNYNNITVFQADLPCVACGEKGCNNNLVSDCLKQINPNTIFKEIKEWSNSYSL
jgi:heptosyltransferase III